MSYEDEFIKAIELSDEWECTSANDFEPKVPHDATKGDYVNVADAFFSNAPNLSEVRLSCARVHFALWEEYQRKGLPSFITIGDVTTAEGHARFGTTIENLANEWSSKNYFSGKNIDMHVWLTLPDYETIIDATIIPHLMGKKPGKFDSNTHLFITGFQDIPGRHVPLLVGITFLFQSGAIPMPYQRF